MQVRVEFCCKDSSKFSMALLQAEISRRGRNFAERISCVTSGLHAQLMAPIRCVNRVKKNFCWIEKIWQEMARRSRQSNAHRANHPNHLVIRDRFQSPSFAFKSSFTVCGLALPPDSFMT